MSGSFFQKKNKMDGSAIKTYRNVTFSKSRATVYHERYAPPPQNISVIIWAMKLVVLGSGTSVPHSERSNSAYWVETPRGRLLLDCGPTAAHRMAEARLPWHQLDAIWISHFHLDHVGGLAPFLFSIKHAPQTQERATPLRIFGPAGLGKLVAAFDGAYNYGLLDQRFPVEVVEVDALEKFSVLDDLEGVAMKTPHTPESHAIHLASTDGRTLVYSADTGHDERLGALARKVGLFLLECSFVKNKPVEKHLELAEAIDLIRRAEPTTAVLTHLYPEWDDVVFQELLAEYSTKSQVVQAFDGMRLEI